jgi:DNA-directed RNA polymerase specialized sigma24 family protein
MEEGHRAETLRTLTIIAEIPVTVRSVLLLRSWDKLSYPEIQARTGIPVFMVQRLMVRARLLMVYYDMAI